MPGGCALVGEQALRDRRRADDSDMFAFEKNGRSPVRVVSFKE